MFFPLSLPTREERGKKKDTVEFEGLDSFVSSGQSGRRTFEKDFPLYTEKRLFFSMSLTLQTSPMSYFSLKGRRLQCQYHNRLRAIRTVCMYRFSIDKIKMDFNSGRIVQANSPATFAKLPGEIYNQDRMPDNLFRFQADHIL
ncbi:MAG: hypothetical protein IT314_17750 [Anaerolineales bacterium]|nr:hypothetical protein [Anaerolineales bacterium]